MNKTFKVVYNRARSGMTAVSEMARSMQGKGAKTVIAVGVAALLTTGAVMAGDFSVKINANPEEALVSSNWSYDYLKNKVGDAKEVSVTIKNETDSMINAVNVNSGDLTIENLTSLAITQSSSFLTGTGGKWDAVFIASNGKTLKLSDVDSVAIETACTTNNNIGMHAFGGNIEISGTQNLTIQSDGNSVFAQGVNGKPGKVSVSAKNISVQSEDEPTVFGGSYNKVAGGSATIQLTSEDGLIIGNKNRDCVSIIDVQWPGDPNPGNQNISIELTGKKAVEIDAGRYGLSVTRKSPDETTNTIAIHSDRQVRINGGEEAIHLEQVEKNSKFSISIDAPDIVLNGNVVLSSTVESKPTLSLTGTSTINGEVKAENAALQIGGETVFNNNATIGKLEGADGKKTKLTLGNADATVHVTNNAITGENLTLSTTSEVNDALGGDVNALLEKFEGQAVIEGAAVVLPEGFSAGETTAVVGANGKAQNVSSHVNSVMSNTLDVSMVSSLAINRILMNDVRKRLGDIRSASGTHGAWVRYDGGKLKGSNSLKSNFTTVQVGIDTMPSDNDPRFGLAFAYTKSDADMKRGDADMDSYSLALYGTKTFDNGVFVDVIGRAALSKADYTVDGRLKGSADNTALSLSGEIGWRYDVTPMFFVEPQAEITYTYTDADTLKLGGAASYSFDTVDSLLGRAGFAAGLNCPDGWGNVYVHASAVHEFLGDATIRSGVNSYKVNGEDTWVEYGLGANINIGKNAYVYGGVERTSGATLDEEWRAHVGFRYSF